MKKEKRRDGGRGFISRAWLYEFERGRGERERDDDDDDGADEWGLNHRLFLPLKTKREEREMRSSSERGEKKKAAPREACMRRFK